MKAISKLIIYNIIGLSITTINFIDAAGPPLVRVRILFNSLERRRSELNSPSEVGLE